MWKIPDKPEPMTVVKLLNLLRKIDDKYGNLRVSTATYGGEDSLYREEIEVKNDCVIIHTDIDGT